MRPTDRLSGHIVRGVVEGIAAIESFTPDGDAIIARFRTPPELLRYMVVKGPVCIDGASLTIIDKTRRHLRRLAGAVHAGAHHPARQDSPATR